MVIVYGKTMKPRSKVVWNNPVPATKHIPTRQLGWLPGPHTFYKGLVPELQNDYSSKLIPGSLFVLSQHANIINGAWDKTDFVGEQIPYLSARYRNPSGNAVISTIPKGTIAIYVEQRRISEWDGKGWARYLRPAFIVNSSLVLALEASTILPCD